MSAGKSAPLPHSNIFTLLDTVATKCPVVVYNNGGVAVGGDIPRLPKEEKSGALANQKYMFVVAAPPTCFTSPFSG